MTGVFVDTFYWIASISRRDQWHERALELELAVKNRPLVTTQAVLLEVLNYFSGYGSEARGEAAGIVDDILHDAQIDTVPLTHDSFLAGLEFYKARPDKSYSLTDCISMNVMHGRGITDVLTHDRHFAQKASTYCSRESLGAF